MNISGFFYNFFQGRGAHGDVDFLKRSKEKKAIHDIVKLLNTDMFPMLNVQ